MKKKIMRSCVVTKEKLEKRDLLRIVRNKEGEVFVDESGKLNGKGAYLKKDKEVILQAQKSKILERVLEVKIPDNLYDTMLNSLDK